MASQKALRLLLAAAQLAILNSVLVAAARSQEKNVQSALPAKQIIPFAAMLFYEEGRNLLKAGKSDEALSKLQRAVQECPEFFQAHLDIGQEYYRRQDLTAAVNWLEKARVLNDRDPRVYRLFGMMLMEQSRFKLAEYAFREALERDATFAQTYQTHGVVLVNLAVNETDANTRNNWLTQAETQLRKSLEMSEGKLAYSHLHLARVYEQRGDNAQAAQELESFLLKNPNAANAAEIRAGIAKLKKSGK